MKKLLTALLPAVLLHAAFAQNNPIPIIPQPQHVQAGSGNFSMDANTPLVLQGKGLENSANFLNGYLKQVHGFTLKTATASKANGIVLSMEKSANPVAGAYTLEVTEKGISIKGQDEAGVFYGVQSLLQLVPLQKSSAALVRIPAVKVEDAPRFAYRGMMLDVGRHFEGVDFIKKMLDQLAMLKINTFHWHLTEDQGWRIEIKKYPKLTEVGAWRDGTIIGHHPGSGNDNQHYGGFFTQQQVKEIVKYASDRYITIIPEIEMPGHSSAAIAAYPWLSCFPDEDTKLPKNPSTAANAKKGKSVIESWGVYEDVFAPTEQTFKFLQDVIDEIVPLFPGKYIHVGGDECPKTAWKRSPFCQQLIKEKGLKDEHELQSYFIQRMEKYINSKGKQIIGWDEILEGGLAPNATVMSWRGEKGGIDAAKQNHDVVMSPNGYCYLDHSQTKNEDSVVIGGFTTLDKIYSYDPLPEELKGTENAKYVKGVQANVWTEYMRYPTKVEYMVFPRIAALSEVAWTNPENKSWDNFQLRIPNFFQRLQLMHVNFSKAFYDIGTSIEPAADGNGVVWKLDTKNTVAKIYYGAPGMNELPYQQPVSISKSGTYTASMRDGSKTLNSVTQAFNLHLAAGKNITLTTPPSKKYQGNGGTQGLLNAATSSKGLNSAEWCGWEGKDMEAVIDLGKEQNINEVTLNTMESQGSWIYRPASFTVWLSKDGKEYTQAGTIDSKAMTVGDDFRKLTVPVKNTAARFVKVQAANFGIIPEGLAGAGNPAWMFVDEIEVK